MKPWHGRQLRDMLYVDDAVEALLLAGADTRPGSHVFNVGGSKAITLYEIARSVAAAAAAANAGRSRVQCIPFPEDRKAIDIGSYYSDITKIRQELGWEPRTDFQAGVEHTVAFYRRFAEHYLNGPVDPSCQLKTLPRQLPAAVAKAASGND